MYTCSQAASPTVSWCAPSETLALEHDEVHVWRASLDSHAVQVQSLRRTLAASELRRAKRYRFERDRQRFIIARGLLRAILSLYVGIEPDQLRFRYGAQGKPRLARETGGESFRFNVSHSHKLALYAVTRNRELGVDLEYLHSDLADVEIAELSFSPREVAALHALPAEVRKEAFFTCWTRKEAYLKAKGDGLTLRLDQFDVSLAPGEPAVLLNTKGDPQEASRWSLLELDSGSGYVAALAVEGQDWQLKCWQWRELIQ